MNWNVEEIRRRYDRWWGRDQTGPLVYIEVLRNGAQKAPILPSWVKDDPRWGFVHPWLAARERGQAGGLDGLLAGSLAVFQATRYAGDGYPRINLNLGPGSAAAYLTGFLKFGEGTSWFELEKPMPWDSILRLKAREDNHWWSITKEMTAFLARESGDRFIVGYPDLGGLMDILASLRTSNQLLEDLIEEPELVKESLRLILDLWHKYYDDLSKILSDAGQKGTGAWMEMWCRQKWYPLQCDIAFMFGGDMFEELAMPTLVEQCARIEQPIFHWDGPGQLKHLDHLLSIERLAGIQWVPGAGQPGQEDERWFPYYEKILRSGKRLVLNYLAPHSVPVIIKRLGGKGLFLQAWCTKEEEAIDLSQELHMPIQE